MYIAQAGAPVAEYLLTVCDYLEPTGAYTMLFCTSVLLGNYLHSVDFKGTSSMGEEETGLQWYDV